MSCHRTAFRIPCNDDLPRMTTPDPAFEQRALHLFRDLLDRDPAERAHLLEPLEPALRERVRELLVKHLAG